MKQPVVSEMICKLDLAKSTIAKCKYCTPSRKPDHVTINLTNSRSESFKKAMQQVKVLTEDNKRLESLEEQNKKLLKDIQEKEKHIMKVER